MSKTLLVCALVMAHLSGWAQSTEDKHRQKDIERHRAMAAAHQAAAQCLAAGKPYQQCQNELLASCKGLGIGKYCGMKHDH